ncbi:MAG: HDOD domain-containing protein [Gallionella sp.]|nr:HDOD domain-containing protein [Gallionella sp.]
MNSDTKVHDLRHALDRLESLPAMPAIARKLLALPLETEEGEAKLLTLIEQDPQIAAKIVGMANSPLFGVNRKVLSVHDAAIVLGLTRVKSVAVGVATMAALTRLPEGKLKAEDVWLHSVSIALAMRGIAAAMPANRRPPDDQIFLAGLLHDIGYIALGYLDTSASNALHDRFGVPSGRALLETEQFLLGMHHGEIGAQLARHWDLPEAMVAVIRYHHLPDEAGAEAGQPLVALVSLAEKMLSPFGVDEHAEEEVTEDDWRSLGIDPAKAEQVREHVAGVEQQARQIAGAGY